jgi:hypothetical protein
VARNTHTNVIALHANSGRGAVQSKSGHQAESVTDIPYDVGTVRGGAFLAEPDVDGLAKLAPSSRHWAAHGCRSTGSTDDRAIQPTCDGASVPAKPVAKTLWRVVGDKIGIVSASESVPLSGTHGQAGRSIPKATARVRLTSTPARPISKTNSLRLRRFGRDTRQARSERPAIT